VIDVVYEVTYYLFIFLVLKIVYGIILYV